ncbi:MAG: TIGR04283 family arsenosugar biosynthesis glycosyltransferase [Pseudomonadota bacterium]
MPAPLSVILPTLNAAHELAPILADLTQGVQSGLVAEVIFADGGSTDDTAQIAEEVGATLITSPPGRGTQLAAGCAASRAPFLLICHTDCRLPSSWPETVSTALETAPTSAHYGKLRFNAKGLWPRWTERWAAFRSRVLGLPYGDQTLLLSKSLYTSSGGYPAIPLMEDVALARALRGHLRPLDLTVTTSARRYEAEGWLKRGAKNLILLSRYFLGASPTKLAQEYTPPKDPR